MKGWTPQGREVELTAWQERAVRALLEPDHQQCVIIWPRVGGKTVTLETARRYALNPGLLPPD